MCASCDGTGQLLAPHWPCRIRAALFSASNRVALQPLSNRVLARLSQRSRLLEANYLSSYVDRATERTKKGLKEEVVSELQKGELLRSAGSGSSSAASGPKQA